MHIFISSNLKKKKSPNNVLCDTETPLLPGVSLGVASKFGMVTMSNCIEAFLYTIEDTRLNGKRSMYFVSRQLNFFI